HTTARWRRIRSVEMPTAARWKRVFPIRTSAFGFASDFVIRASSFPHVLPHNVFLVGALVSFLGADQVTVIKIKQRVVHQPHALFFASLNNTRQHICLCFANHVCYRGRVGEDFQREHPTSSVFFWN